MFALKMVHKLFLVILEEEIYLFFDARLQWQTPRNSLKRDSVSSDEFSIVHFALDTLYATLSLIWLHIPSIYSMFTCQEIPCNIVM